MGQHKEKTSQEPEEYRDRWWRQGRQEWDRLQVVLLAPLPKIPEPTSSWIDPFVSKAVRAQATNDLQRMLLQHREFLPSLKDSPDMELWRHATMISLTLTPGECDYLMRNALVVNIIPLGEHMLPHLR